MIIVYTAPSSASSRKAKEWFKKHGMKFITRNANVNPLSAHEIQHLLQMTENGTADLLSTRSKIYNYLTNKLHIDFDSIPLSSLIHLMSKYPSLIRRPVIFNNRGQLEVGYNEDTIRQFLPPSYRHRELKHMQAII